MAYYVGLDVSQGMGEWLHEHCEHLKLEILYTIGI